MTIQNLFEVKFIDSQLDWSHFINIKQEAKSSTVELAFGQLIKLYSEADSPECIDLQLTEANYPNFS